MRRVQIDLVSTGEMGRSSLAGTAAFQGPAKAGQHDRTDELR
jgi:hypothetical protein